MNKHSKQILAVAFVLALPVMNASAAVRGENDDINVEARWFVPKLNFSIKSDRAFFKVGDQKFTYDKPVQVNEVLNIEDKAAPNIRFTFKNVELDYVRVRKSGVRTGNYGPVEWNDKFYTGEGKADGYINLDYFNLNWKKSFISGEYINAHWGMGVKVFNFDTHIGVDAVAHEDIPGNRVDHVVKASYDNKFFGAAPDVNIGAEVYLGKSKKLKLYGDINGLPLGRYGYTYDYELGLKYKPSKNFSADVGYRVVDLTIHTKNEDYVYKLKGPYMGMAYHF